MADVKADAKHGEVQDVLENGEAPVRLNEDFSNIVIIDNIPVVGMEKYQKLCDVIRKLYSIFGKIVPEGFYVPVEGNPQKTAGYAFVEYETATEAQAALAQGDNKQLDAHHVLRVSLYSDFDKYAQMPDEYVAPPKGDTEVKSFPNAWLRDAEGRDQFLLRFSATEHKQHKHETHIHWSDPINRPNDFCRELVYDGNREKVRGKAWTELYTAWSPRGTYLATFHAQGIVLWAGDDFQKVGRYAHSGVKTIDFSPCEKYLITSIYDERKLNDPQFVIVWDILKQQQMRTFDAAGSMAWPSFRWSFDDKYFVRSGRDMISVYETPHMGLLEKKSIKVQSVQEVQISPSDNLISYWVPERDNIPALIGLMALPSRKVLREKHATFVTDVRMHWQMAGDFLCCKLSRRKAKKPLPTMFLVFRLRNKEIPIEEVELPDVIHAFAWEPKGTRFAIAHGEQTGGRCNVSFYNITKKKVELVKTLEGRTCNSLFWSPSGPFCVLAGLGPLGGVLEFVDSTTVTPVASGEHFQCTDIEWSPCGRYLLTASTQPLEAGGNIKATIENTYKLWTMQGRQLMSRPMEQLFQALWRPRPPSALSKEQKDEKYLKDKYWDIFAKKDQKTRDSQLSGVAAMRQKLKDEWKALRSEHLKDYNDDAQLRADLRGGVLSDEDEDFVTIETLVEEEVSRKEEVVSAADYARGTKEAKAAKAAAAAAYMSAARAADAKDSKDDDDDERD